MDVIVPGLGDEDDRVGVGGEQRRRRPDRWRPSARAAWSCRRRRSARCSSASARRIRCRADWRRDSRPRHSRRRAGRAGRRCGACRRARNRRRSSARRRAASCRRDRGVLGHRASSVSGRRRGLGAERLGHGGVGEPFVADAARDCVAARRSPGARTAGSRCRWRRSSGASRRAPARASSSASISARPTPRRGECGIDKQHVDRRRRP